MYLLAFALVSGNALAQPSPYPISTYCGTRPPPCLGITIGADGSIMPGDWYEQMDLDLGGNLNWFRVEVVASGRVGVEIGGYELNERNYAREESDERTSVYYVPATYEALVVAWGDRGEALDLLVTGTEKPGF